MDILVAILIIVVIAAVAFVALRRRPGGAAGLERPHRAPLGRSGHSARRSSDPMAAAVADHAAATDPADVVVAEQRLRAQARSVAAGMTGSAAAAHADPAYGQPAPYADQTGYAQPGAAYAPPPGPATAGGGYYGSASAAASPDPNLDRDFDPATGERVDGYEDPASDPRLNDSRYDGRLAADYVDPREDDRYR